MFSFGLKFQHKRIYQRLTARTRGIYYIKCTKSTSGVRKLKFADLNTFKWVSELAHLYELDTRPAMARYISLAEEFGRTFGEQEAFLVSAPGRTELAGNHTDHQNGIVLCAAVTRDTLAAAAASDDNTVDIRSRGFGDIRVSLDDLSPRPEESGTSAGIVRGVAAALKKRGCGVGGFRAVMDSQVPAGSGLSSSAAFEVLVGSLFNLFYNDFQIDPMTVAMAGQTAERDYFGKPSGLMDQAASACGGITMIDFADPDAPKVERIDFDFRKNGYVLCAVDTRTSHADLTDDYASIPADMKQCARALGAELLRYADPAALSGLEKDLPRRALLRAEHFFGENARVPLMADALRRGDMAEYIRQMNASGASSREKLQNVIPSRHPESSEMAAALDRAEALLTGKGAWRIHGGGFAGCIQCLVPAEDFDGFRKKMDAYYGEGACFELRVRPCGPHIFGTIV